jgi:hypothetical protein
MWWGSGTTDRFFTELKIESDGRLHFDPNRNTGYPSTSMSVSMWGSYRTN